MNTEQQDTLLQTLKVRFERHPQRHPGVAWDEVQARLDKHPATLAALAEMERTGGEPDVIGAAGRDGSYTFCDCSAESPTGRRSLCFDAAALAARKENKPAGSAMAQAEAMGITLLERRSTARCRAWANST